MSRKLLMFLFLAFLITATAQNPAVTINVDASAKRRPISPLIYGTNFADAAALSDLNAPVNRYGGNNSSRYNWQQNADNKDNDWYYESIALGPAVQGGDVDSFVGANKSAGAQSMITVPMIGWVAKVGPNREKLASFSIKKYGSQTGADYQWFPDAGNGIRSGGGYVTGNDPNDANVPNSSAFQKQWMQWLLSKWGGAAAGGPRYYLLDNEHSIWFSTHRDVQPVGPHHTEIRDRVLDYAAMVKSVDPNAKVVGPEEWGWSAFIFSGYDQQVGAANGWTKFPDREAMGGMDYIPWLLQQWKTAHPIDVFSVHWYPQGGEFSDDVSQSMQLLRNRSTRALWDPTYKDPTWISDYVQLIPRMRQWMNAYYDPSTPIAITEYNWGAENHINGATTQADILGIFGREGLDVATRWTTPAATTPTYKAMKMYRNYDGNKSTFGDISVSTAAPNPDALSAFGAVRSSDGALTLTVISKTLTGSTPVTVSLSNFAGNGSAQVYQLTSANAITRLADMTYSGGALSATVPPQSVTLFVLPAAGGNLPPNALMTATPVSGTAPLSVAFDGSQSKDADGSIVSYDWSFGNGATATGVTASYTYTAAGTYTATLKVTDNKGAVSIASATITVAAPPNKPPTAIMSATPVSGNAPLTVSFSSAGSSDPDGTITNYSWSFGTGATAAGANASYTYTSPGTYTATLKVTDNAGATATASKVITVTGTTTSSACAVRYVNINDWKNGFQADIYISNAGKTAINGWTLAWQFAGNQQITNLWNGLVAQTGKSVVVRNESWNGTINAGATTQIGFVASYSGTNAKPTAFKLNGVSCKVQ